MTVIADLDPRTKLFIIACVSSSAVIINDWVCLTVLFLLSILLLLMSGINPVILVQKTRLLFYMVIFIALMQSIFGPSGRYLVELGSVKLLTTGGLIMAVEFILRMAIIIASAGILSTSSSRQIIQGLVQLKLPYEIAFMASMGITFLPVFAQEFQDAVIAVQLRGIDFRKLSLTQKMEVISSLFQPVAAGAIIKARAIAMSLEMRAFRAYPTRTSYLVLKYQGCDYAVMTGIALVTAVLLGWYFLV